MVTAGISSSGTATIVNTTISRISDSQRKVSARRNYDDRNVTVTAIRRTQQCGGGTGGGLFQSLELSVFEHHRGRNMTVAATMRFGAD